MRIPTTSLSALLVVGSLTCLSLRPAAAKVEVFACEPAWGAVAEAVGGDLVSVYTATTAQQDPHHLQARPSLIARLRRADLLLSAGSQLEIGWLPVLLRQAGNDRVQPGQPGNLAAADHVDLLEKPQSVDRSQGDVHPGGNPHVQTDPRRLLQVAEVVSERLGQIDPDHAQQYANRYADFAQRWHVALDRWTREAAPLRGVKVVVHHKGWVYLMDWLGLDEVAQLEPMPGVPPSASHLSQVLARLERDPAQMVIRAAYQEGRPAEWLGERAGIRVVVLPFDVGGTDGAKDLFGLYDDTLQRLLEAAR